jgi:hypothetical protein
MLQINKSEFELQEIPDESPDWSYLEQDEFEDRLSEFKSGDFYFVGIRASVEIKIPSKQGGYWTIQRISSPGLWGIESDSGSDYFQEVFQEECNILSEMLETMGMKVIKGKGK